MIASVAVVGSALARGGKESQASPRVQRTLSARQLAAGKPFTVKITVVHEKAETLALVPVTVGGEKLISSSTPAPPRPRSPAKSPKL